MYRVTGLLGNTATVACVLLRVRDLCVTDWFHWNRAHSQKITVP